MENTIQFKKYLNEGNALLREGKLREAIAFYDKAIEIFLKILNLIN